MEGFPFCLSYSVLCNLEKSPLSDSIFSTAKWGYSSSPNYWVWLLGGPKGTTGVLYTNVVSAGVENLQHRSRPCLLLLGDDLDVQELSAVPGISTETPWRGSACSKESLPDCGFISTPRWWGGMLGVKNGFKYPSCDTAGLFLCSARESSPVWW